MYVAAACHDVDHRGFNNIYAMNAKTDLALLYNDVSVMENHHIAFSFNLLLSSDEFEWTTNWSNDDFKRFREIMISIILSTDMSKHFSDIAKAKARLGANDFDIKKKDKIMCMDTLVHTADISNPIKIWNPCFNWTTCVMEEFWQQGDMERE
eukprot:TRINITY_DN67425_c0_g1_i2.p2 TRINITY_DN67425_c0_g1~~TRINITY_DN67425_c0_g1_i2.p2  ORF type:complete len:152 (+),score=2.48 TRINITY_DN67425_c0_g1_i2:1343-1798(+)